MPNEVTGMSRYTLRTISGWDCVREQIEEILATPFMSRVMRPHVGSNAHKLIGELSNPQTAQRFKVAVALAILFFVPNFRPTRVDWFSLDRTGENEWIIEGWYYPRAHLGDMTGRSYRSLVGSSDIGTLTTLAL